MTPSKPSHRRVEPLPPVDSNEGVGSKDIHEATEIIRRVRKYGGDNISNEEAFFIRALIVEVSKALAAKERRVREEERARVKEWAAEIANGTCNCGWHGEPQPKRVPHHGNCPQRIRHVILTGDPQSLSQGETK